jgi:hypothetical protein
MRGKLFSMIFPQGQALVSLPFLDDFSVEGRYFTEVDQEVVDFFIFT